VRDVSKSERNRLVALVCAITCVVGLPLWILIGAAVDNTGAQGWLQGAAIGASFGVGLWVAVKDLARRRPD